MAAFRSECVDFLQFQDVLKKMREIDDKITYTLNVNLPTESFKQQKDSSNTCKELFGEFQKNYDKRQEVLQTCIKFTKERLLDLKKLKETSNDDISIHKALKKEQSKLRLLESELGVEEVLRNKTSRVLYERCRSHYVPPNYIF